MAFKFGVMIDMHDMYAHARYDYLDLDLDFENM